MSSSGTERPAESPAGGAAPGGSAEGASRLLTRRTLTYLSVWSFMRVWYALMFPTRIEGLEHVPATGGVLLAANHRSYLDIPLISNVVPRHVSFVARDTLARSGILAFVMKNCGAVLIRRGTGDRPALREMAAHLELGDVVAIFPEGTRSPDGRLQAFRGGALLAARMARVPIVPVAISGTLEAWPRGRKLPRPQRFAIRFAAPVPWDAPDALERVRGEVERMLSNG